MTGPYENETYTVCLRRDPITGVVVSEAWYLRNSDDLSVKEFESPERYVTRNRGTGNVTTEKFWRSDGLSTTQQYGPTLESTVPKQSDRAARRSKPTLG